MSFLIQSANVYKETELHKNNDGSFHCTVVKGNIGSLPTLFHQDGTLNQEANSYLFYQKTVKQAKDLSPCAQALHIYYQFLEDNDLSWNKFPPIKRLKPTYLFRSHSLKLIQKGELAHSTASTRLNKITN